MKKNLYTRLGGALGSFLILLSLLAPQVFAQTDQNAQAGFNFSTSPVITTLEVKPGEAVSTKIQIKNNGLSAENVKANILKLGSNNNDGSPVLTDLDPNDDFAQWVTFSENTFVAEPNVWKTIDVTVKTPASAAFGYYYAIVFSRNTDTHAQGVSNIAASIAVPMLLDVQAPGSVRKADITEFTINKNVFEFLPANFNVKLKNSGNVHVAPRGNIFITKGGKNVAILEVNQASGNILPNSTRQFGTDWNDGFPVYKLKEENGKVVLKNGKQVSTLSWSDFNPSKIRFGKYHAKVALIYNDGVGDVSTEAELDFWVIPWRIIGIVVLILLLIGIGLWVTLIRPLRKGIKKLPGKKKQPTTKE